MQESVTFQALNGAEDKINETKVQFIPAKMDLPTSGRAPVYKYFDQYTEELDGGKYSCCYSAEHFPVCDAILFFSQNCRTLCEAIH